MLPLAEAVGGEVQLAVVGDWDACLPVRRLSSWHHVPLPSLSTWQPHPLYSLLGTPLVADAGAAEELARELKGGFFSGLDWLVPDGPVCEALVRAAGKTTEFERFERAFLARRPENDYTEGTLSSKAKRELRRTRRKLGEDLNGEVVVTDRAGDDAALDELIELEGRSALAERGQVLSAHENEAKFFRAACRNFAAAGRLQVLELRAGEKQLALKVNIRAGEGIFYFKIAYDEDFSRYSPGIQLELESVRIFHEETDAQWIDSCADPNNAMINRLWPDRRTLATLVFSQGARGAVARPAIGALRAVRNRRLQGEETT